MAGKAFLLRSVLGKQRPGLPGGQRQGKRKGVAGEGVEKFQPRALEGEGPFPAAAVFSVSPEGMLPGSKLDPDLMGPPGVEGNFRQTHRPGFGGDPGGQPVFQHRLPHPFPGPGHRIDPPGPAVLEKIIPQDPRFRQGLVRPAREDGPISLDKGRGLLRRFPASRRA